MASSADTILGVVQGLAGAGALAGALYWGVGFSRIQRTLRAFPTAEAGLDLPGAAEDDSVCIVIPAHNEAHAIAELVGSLRAQTWPRLHVVLALDRCTDETERVAREAIGGDERFTVHTIEECPPGWAGKAHAAWRGARDIDAARRAGLLLFADADTQFHAECVRACVRLLRNRGLGLLSLLSTLSADRWYERIAQPAAVLELMRQYPLASANRWPNPRAFANGQFMLFTREAYDASGGHEAVKSHLLEDIALARHTARAGHRVGVLRAGDMLRCRMYEDWAAFRRGWKRIFTEASNRRSSRLAAAARRHLLLSVMAPAAAIAAIGVGIGGGGWLGWLAAALGAASLATYMASMVCIVRAQQAPTWCAATIPVGGVLVVRTLWEARTDLRRGRASSWGGMSYSRADRDHPDDPGTTNL